MSVGRLGVPTAPWREVYVDMMGPFRKSAKGNQYILVALCNFTKSVEVKAVRRADDATFAAWFLTEVITRHGCPEVLVSDRGGNFISGLCDELYKTMAIKKHTITAYRPQSNSPVERVNGTLKTMIRAYTGDGQRNRWDEYLSSMVFAYQTTPHASTGFSPFFLEHGREARMPVDVLLRPPGELHADLRAYHGYLVDVLAWARGEALRRLEIAQQETDRRVGADVPLPVYPVGAQVLVYEYAPMTGETRMETTLWSGPYTVMSRSEDGVSYVLDRDGKEDRVLVNRLKPAVVPREFPHRFAELERAEERVAGLRPRQAVASKDEEVGEEKEEVVVPEGGNEEEKGVESEELEVERILGRRWASRRSRMEPAYPEYHIKWHGYGEEENTWERWENLLNCDHVLKEYWESVTDPWESGPPSQEELAKYNELMGAREASKGKRRTRGRVA